jgi:glycosyltransferase involved in cell wall biosynthesis
MPDSPSPPRARVRARARATPVRVVFVTPDLRVGGAERHLVTLASALDRSRFSATVLCVKGIGPLHDELRASGVEVLCLHAGERRRALPVAFAALVRELRGRRAEVVVTHGLSANVLGRLAATLARVPVRITWKHNCGHLGRHGLLERCSERLLGPLCTRYIGVAHGQVPYLVDYLRLPPRKLRIIHNSVEVGHYGSGGERQRAERRGELGLGELGLAAGDPVVAVSAVLRREKDHATVLRAIGRLTRQLPRVKLLLIGDGPERERLRRLAAELGIAERVLFMGSRGDAPELLGCADVVALASRTVECFPYAILEAMAMSRPAVCTAVGGLPEMVEDGVTGYLVPPRDPRALAAALGRVLGSEDRGRAMGEAARRRLEERFPFPAMLRAAECELLAAFDDERPEDERPAWLDSERVAALGNGHAVALGDGRAAWGPAR